MSKQWTVNQLLGEVAAIYVRLEHDLADDALEMSEQIVKSVSPDVLKQAEQEYAAEQADDDALPYELAHALELAGVEVEVNE